jgi:murein DD-endopeptidase MepM/ murein hydrolase activator NlpD
MPPAAALALALALAAGPALDLAPAEARPGDAVLVTVTGAAAAPEGTLAGRRLAFWREPAGEGAGPARWRALAALPLETPAGPAAAEVVADGVPLSGALAVRAGDFPARALTVAPRFLEPPASVKARIAADRAAFEAAFARPFEPPRFEGPFAWPRPPEGRRGRFGDQRTFNGRRESVHYGLDLAGPVGASVLAAQAGEVVLARDCYLSGKSLVLWHGAGLFTVYFHLDELLVEAGDAVERGALVGRVGNTGRSTGPHLHLGARVDGLYVDPESLFALLGAEVTAPAPAARPR